MSKDGNPDNPPAYQEKETRHLPLLQQMNTVRDTHIQDVVFQIIEILFARAKDGTLDITIPLTPRDIFPRTSMCYSWI
jgi:hypothetical protein